MVSRIAIFRIIQQALWAIPNWIRGKARLTRIVLEPFRTLKPICIPDRFGNKLWCPSVREPIAMALFAQGVYEQSTIDVILAALPAKGIYVDVGANVGAIALPIAAQRPAARLVCVEADPQIAAFLRSNVAENGYTNISVQECLAGPVPSSAVSFYRSPDDSFGMGSIGPQFGELPITLRQQTLDDLMDEMGIAEMDVLKLDIEGAELGALQGLARRLSGRRPPVIVFEFMDWAETRIPGQAAGDAQKFLLSLGYNLFSLSNGSRSTTALPRPHTVGSAMILARPGAVPQSGLVR